MGNRNVTWIFGAKADQFHSELQKIQKGAAQLGKSMEKIGQNMSKNLTAPLLAMGGLAIKSSADMEKLKVSLESMTGSAESAGQVINELREFATKTPFQINDIGAATKQLLAVGIATSDVVDKLKFLGDISAGANVPLNEMASIFGKVQSKGKAMTEEVLQLSDRGIPIIDELAKVLNVSKDEIFDLASQSKITSDIFEKAMMNMSKSGGVFGDQMSKQSNTTYGLWSTLTDTVTNSLASIGDSISEAFDLKGVIKDLTNFSANIGKSFDGLSDSTKRMIVIFGGFAAAVGPTVLVLGKLVTLFATMNPVVLSVTAGVIGISAAIAGLPALFSAATAGINRLRGASDIYDKSIIEQKNKLNVLVTQLKLTNDDQNQRKKLIDEINTIYPGFLDNIDLEKTGYSELNDKLKLVNQELVNKAILTKQDSKVAAQAQKVADLFISKYEKEIKVQKLLAEAVTEYNLEIDESASLADQYAQVVQQLSSRTNGFGIVLDPVKQKMKALGDAYKFGFNSVKNLSSEHQRQLELLNQMKIAQQNLYQTLGIVNTQTDAAANSQSNLNSALSRNVDAMANLSRVDLTPLALSTQAVGTSLTPVTWKVRTFTETASEMSLLVQQAFGEMFVGVGESLGNMLASVGSGKDLLNNVLKSFIDFGKQLGKIFIAIGVARLEFFKSITSPAGAIKLIIAGTALVALSTAASKLMSKGPQAPALAEGGLAYGPTMAMVGDNPNAKINPEVIAPLDKLKGIMNGGGGGQLTARIKGEDILFIYDRAAKKRGRRT